MLILISQKICLFIQPLTYFSGWSDKDIALTMPQTCDRAMGFIIRYYKLVKIDGVV